MGSFSMVLLLLLYSGQSNGACNRYCRTTDKGQEYCGLQNTTVNGRTCQAWATNTPHAHGFGNADSFPEDTLDDAKNFCRNPDLEPCVWCYTMDPAVRWECCSIPLCACDPNSPFTRSAVQWALRDVGTRGAVANRTLTARSTSECGQALRNCSVRAFSYNQLIGSCLLHDDPDTTLADQDFVFYTIE